MTVHFAAPLSRLGVHLEGRTGPVATPVAANDNDNGLVEETMLDAALRHFAEYGLAAAQHARCQAEDAFFAGDRISYQWWLGICRALDRRLAREIDRRMENRT